MPSPKFDLDKAISAWRRGLQNRRAILAEDLDELEQHMRDQVASLVAQGLGEEEAFLRTQREMGDDTDAEAEYRKVYWGKLKRKNELAGEVLHRLSMAGNYLKVAFRSLCRQKGYAFINVFSLAVGLAFCALIFLYVRDELSFDRFHEGHERIFRISHPSYGRDGSFEGMYLYQPPPLGPALKAELPEVEEYVRFTEGQYAIRIGGGREVFQQRVFFADTSVFNIFTFPLLRGDRRSVFAGPNSLVLSESAVSQYFGDLDPLGQTIDLRLGGQFLTFTVTGLARDIPGNSSIRFDFLAPYANVPVSPTSDDWRRVSVVTYVRLAPGVQQEDVEAALVPFRRLHYPWEAEEEQQGRAPVRFRLEPLADTHFNTSAIGGFTPAGDPMYSFVLGGVGLLVLAVACFNFMTLAIGRSASRGMEVGIRKAVGATRWQLMWQFWVEALLLTLLALVLGHLLAHFFLPSFNTLTEKGLYFDYFGDVFTIPAFFGMMLLTALVAGSYPALVLSGIRPVEILKSKLRLGGSNVLTKTLVVSQFSFSVLLIVGALVVLGQLRYMRTQDPGFDKEHVVVIPSSRMGSTTGGASESRRIFAAYRNELRDRGGISGITAVRFPPVLHLSQASIQRQLTAGYHTHVAVHPVDSQFFDVLGLGIVEGRAFDPRVAGDLSRAVMINEAMASRLGWEDPVGRTFDGSEFDRLFEGMPDLTVIGVVKDFLTRPMHFPVQPALLTMNEAVHEQVHKRHLLVRISPDGVAQTLDAMRAAWYRVAPDIPFSFSFLDEDLERQYQSEARWGQIVTYSAGFAILIACLGLLGLVALTVARRRKEIGIRKVMGARVGSIALLLCKDFLKLVMVGFAVATPVAWYFARRWLEHFAYRVELGPEVFLLAGGIALLIALLTVTWQAVKAAKADPVQSLRCE